MTCPRTPWGVRLALPVCLALAACAPSAEPEDREKGPVGHEVYARLLAKEVGARVSVDRFVEQAERARREITARMNALATRTATAGDWQIAFELLRMQSPETSEDLLAVYRREVARAADFVRQHELVSVPDGELEVVEVENLVLRSVFPLALYLDGKLAVTTSAGAEPDPHYLLNHCLVCIPPLAVHEGYPGHHVAFTLMDRVAEAAARGEDAAGSASPPASDRSAAAAVRLPPGGRYNRTLVEGWGLYAELLMLEQGYYSDPERELGAWRMILLRATRARVDALLHGGEMTAAEAVELYQRELQLSEDAARTEVRRHLAEPTMKASYFAGLLQILELRRRALTAEPGESRRSFHDRLLRAAAAPPRITLPEIARNGFALDLDPLAGDVDWSGF